MGNRNNMAFWILGIAIGSLLPSVLIVQYTNWPAWTALPLYIVILGILLFLYFSLTK